MVDELGETDPSEFFVQLGMLILESRQPSISIKGRQDGLHCPRDVGIWPEHVCTSNTAQCYKANQILKQMQSLWRNHVPLCIEVLILPSCVHGQQRSASTDVKPPYEDDGYVLLEQWTIQNVPKKSGEVTVSPKNLFQAVKSYLHFSQLSSWLTSSGGRKPSCIGYRVSPPAEFCTTTFTQDPQLHIFPVGNVNKSVNFKVWLAYLSRMPEIPEPICYEISETGCHCISNYANKPSQDASSKKQMSRSKSPHLRFEAVFQNIKGSPKLVSKSASRQYPLVQQCCLASTHDTKDDAYGIGVSDIKSQYDNRTGHGITCKGTAGPKKVPVSIFGLENDMRNLGILNNELMTSHFLDEQLLGNCNSCIFGSSHNIVGNQKSNHLALSSKASSPMDISKNGRLGMNYAQMLIKDQSITDSENSCSPDIDLFLSETLAKRAEPMNPEEMYDYLSRLCKKKCSGLKFSPLCDATYQTSSKPFNVCQKDEKVNMSDDKRNLNFSEIDECVPINKFSNDACLTKSSVKNLNQNSSHHINERDFLLSGTFELRESVKDQTSNKILEGEYPILSASENNMKPLFSVGDNSNGNNPDVDLSIRDPVDTLQGNEIKEIKHPKCKPVLLESNNRLKSTVSSNLSDPKQFLKNKPASLHLKECYQYNTQQQKLETIQMRPLSAIPRHLQSKTPQDSKQSSLLFLDSKNQKTLHVDILKTVDKYPEAKGDSSCSNKIQDGPRIPNVMEKEGFKMRVQHSSSMVFNTQTKLPMQSSPVPAKRLSSGCFDYDSSLNSVQAIKNSLSCNNLDDAQNSSNGCSRMKQAFSSSAPAFTNCLLGNFEESLINGRIQPAGLIDGFTAEIGASGSFCPSHLMLPCLAFFFSLSEDAAPSPYLGHINLESQSRRGYRVPNKGTVQVTLFNPNKSVVKIFVVTYDVSDMPSNHQTLLRQKTVYMPTPGSPSDVPGAPVYLRYLIHLRFASSKQCKIYLHTDIRLIFARDRFELDNRIYHYELRSFTEAPENPKYSPRK